jgi:hypothetical protein
MRRPVYFTSCNENYLLKYLRSFVASAIEANIKDKFVIDVCPSSPISEEGQLLIDEVKNNFSNFSFVSMPSEFPLNNKWPCKKTYWACRRFLLLPEMLKQYKQVWVTDIDIMFLKPLPYVESQLGYSLTNEVPKLGSKNYERRKIGIIIKGDMIYADQRFYDLAIKVQESILLADRRWYADQIALYNVFREVTDYELIPRSSTKRSDLHKYDFKSYLISPGGTYKKKEEVKKDFDYYNQRYYALINKSGDCGGVSDASK